MRFRRVLVCSLTAGLVAAALTIPPALADETTFGAITQVALESTSKKVSFITKRGEKLELEATASTEIVNGKGEKVTLEAINEALSKATADGKTGVLAKVTYDKTVATKISVGLIEKKPAK
jgi:hypothetical protein